MQRQQVLGLPDMSPDQLTDNLENVFKLASVEQIEKIIEELAMEKVRD